MPLRTSTTVRIRAQRQPTVAARAVTARALAAARPTPIMLDVAYVRQEQTQWCWAACTEMVAEFLGRPDVKQCELANFLHGQSTCCQQGNTAACNRPCSYEGISHVYRHVGVRCISHPWAVNAQVVVKELTAKRPVEIGLAWAGGGGHVSIVRGVTAQGLFAVHDPWYGSGLFTYVALYNAYGMGRWFASYGDFRAGP